MDYRFSNLADLRPLQLVPGFIALLAAGAAVGCGGSSGASASSSARAGTGVTAGSGAAVSQTGAGAGATVGNAGSSEPGGSGTGNAGTGNAGTGNAGTGNAGTGNAGTGNAGTGNAGTGNAGTGNAGTAGNAGTGNVGTGIGVGCLTPNPTQVGQGTTTDRWKKSDVSRNGVNYLVMANGWGPGFSSQSLSWNGSSFTVDAMAGTQGPSWEPASYPTVFCGAYSDSVSGACGLPKAIADTKSIVTGWRWKANTTTGQYNAAYDIWLGTASTAGTMLMVWYHDPAGQQPSGSKSASGVTVTNTPGTWDLWSGGYGGRNVYSYVRAEGSDTSELSFDVMDFIRDLKQRNLSLPDTHVRGVAVGFEIWNGPVTKLASEDFCVDVK